MKKTAIFMVITILITIFSSCPALAVDLSSDVPTDGLMLWVKADSGVTYDSEGTVAKWEDLSGKGNHLIAPDDAARRPVYLESSDLINNMPSVDFSTKQYLIKEGVDYSGNSTLIIYYKSELASLNQTIFSSSCYTGSATTTEGKIPFTLTNSNNDTDGVQFIMSDGSYSTGIPRRNDAFMISMLTLEGKKVNVYNNVSGDNEEISDADSSFELSGEAPYYDSFAFGLKYDSTRVTHGMKGEIAEAMIYDRVLSKEELNKVNKYLKLKYDTPNTIKGIVIDNEVPTMYKGDTFTPEIVLVKTLLGYEFKENISDVTLTSANEDVAVVENGSIRAVGFGKALIKAKYMDEYEVSFSVNVASIKVGESEFSTITPGGTFTCSRTVENLDTVSASVTLMAAIYKKDALVDFDYLEEAELLGEKTFSLSFELPQDVSDYSVCLMLVDSVDGMYPLSKQITYPAWEI